MKEFEYLKPDSIEETISILSQHGEKAQILNGGTDLIVEMRDKIIQPKCIVDIKTIPLAIDKVRFIGEPVAAVAAESEEIAEISFIKIRYSRRGPGFKRWAHCFQNIS